MVLKLAAALAVCGLAGAWYLGSLNRVLERNQDDLAKASADLAGRRAGCAAALSEISRFRGHLGAFIEDKEKEMAEIEAQVKATRERIGDVEKIKRECGELERELDEVRRLLTGRDDVRGAR